MTEVWDAVQVSHSHVHDGPGLGPSSTRVRLVVALVLTPFVVAIVAGLVLLWPERSAHADEALATERARGTVVDVRSCDNEVPECLVATVDVTEGAGAPARVEAAIPFGTQAPEVSEGDRILLSYVAEAPPDQRYGFQDFDRGRPLAVLLALFVVGVLLLSRWRGLGSLLSLALSLGLLVVFTLPALTEGASPLLVAIVTAGAIMMTTLWLSHGFNVRTSVAMLGTLLALVCTGLLGTLFTTIGRFTGLSDEGSQYIAAINAEVDVEGLLLAGLVIGALGVLDDVTVTQAAVVWELAEADQSASRPTLFAQGMRIGRAHVASTVNTLALAYVGAMLPLLLVFSALDLPFGTAVSQEQVAQEVVRGLVGGLGIIAAVPLTTGLAALVAADLTARRRSTSPQLPLSD